MNILELLKQLKHVKPDPAYTARSRFAFTGAELATPRLTFWNVFLQSMQTGGAVALVGVFLVLILGGFSTWQFLTPFRVASLDPTGLKAEAQAIDIQIQLTNIEYREQSADNATTPAVAAPKRAQVVQALVENLGLSTTTAQDASTTTIDDALDALSN